VKARSGVQTLHWLLGAWARLGAPKYPERTWVYFACASDGKIKIGRTGRLRLRIQQLRPRATLVGSITLRDRSSSMLLEGALHEALAASRFRGEWFHPTPEVLATLDAAQGTKPSTEAQQ
jgi:hypothetical protein